MSDDLTPRSPGPQTPARRHSGAVPSLDQYLDLDRSVRAAAIGVSAGQGWPAMQPEDAFTRAYAVEMVKQHEQALDAEIAALLPLNSVQRCRDLAHQAANTPPNRKAVVVAIALLVGSRARQPEDAQTFMRALEFDLVDLGFSPTVVVTALQRLRRESRFMPEIPEVIAACEVERDRLRAVVDRAEKAIRYRAALEDARSDVPALMDRAQAVPDRLTENGGEDVEVRRRKGESPAV